MKLVSPLANHCPSPIADAEVLNAEGGVVQNLVQAGRLEDVGCDHQFAHLLKVGTHPLIVLVDDVV